MTYQKGDTIEQTRNPGPVFVVLAESRMAEVDAKGGRYEPAEVVDARNLNENEVVELLVSTTQLVAKEVEG